jgi:hypothetical protein
MIGIYKYELLNDLESIKLIPSLIGSKALEDRSIKGVFGTAYRMSKLKKVREWQRKTRF